MPPFDAYALPSKAGRAVALRALVGLSGADPETRTGWIHVAPEGEWRGHPEGPFALGAESFRACIAVFETQANPIAIDYGHASLSAAEAPAAGWGQRLDLRDDGLWCEVEFTARAAAAIRAGEYRYCSAVFLFDQPDRVSGETVECQLHSIALTNTPFIDGQQPIALTHSPLAARALSHGASMKIKRDAFEAALATLEGDEFAPEQLVALVEAQAAMSAAQEAPKEEPEEPAEMSAPADAAPLSDAPADAAALATPPEATPGDAGAMLIAKLTEATGMDAAAIMSALEANLDAVVAALGGAGGGPADETAMAALKSTVRALSQRVAEYDAERAVTKAKLAAEQAAARKVALAAEVEALVTAGRLLPSQREKWVALAHKSEATFRELSAELPVVVPYGREASAHTPAAGSATSLELVIDDSKPEVIALRNSLANFGIRDRAAQDTAIRRQMQTKHTAGTAA